MDTNIFDVIVIGAGVAGSSAAYETATAGLKTIVLEKEKIPRYKTCGGGVILRSASLLPFRIDSVVQKEFRMADVYDSENKIKFRIERTQPFIFMTMRSDLDLFLLSKAIENGAKVNDQSEVKEIISNEDYVEVKTSNNTYYTRLVIACDGATGFTMTKFKLNQNIIRAPAVESELFVDEATLSRFKDVVRFDFGFVPHGYGWVFPKKDHLSIGVAFMKKVNQSIQEWFRRYLEFLKIESRNVLRNEKHGYIIPFISGKVKCSYRRILFSGDNLGFADPLTAEGISYAIETGQLAARTIINNYPYYQKIIQNYNSSLESVYREIKSANLLSKVVYGPPALRKFIFRRWGNRLSELLTDVIAGEKKYRKLVYNPVNYLKLFKPAYWILEK